MPDDSIAITSGTVSSFLRNWGDFADINEQEVCRAIGPRDKFVLLIPGFVLKQWGSS